jgi:hypothetical protein
MQAGRRAEIEGSAKLAPSSRGKRSSSSRGRKVGIVALARKLAIALWRFVEDGVIPEGATLKA